MTLSATLQKLRDYGIIRFHGKGKYELRNSNFYHIIYDDLNGSLGEKLTCIALHTLGITYEREKRFSDLKYKGYLRFDFYFIHNNIRHAIEFDGALHDTSVEFMGGDKALEQTKLRDERKNKYCEDNHIKLLRIKNILSYDEITRLIVNFL
jgi:hypothetical protein